MPDQPVSLDLASFERAIDDFRSSATTILNDADEFRARINGALQAACWHDGSAMSSISVPGDVFLATEQMAAGLNQIAAHLEETVDSVRRADRAATVREGF